MINNIGYEARNPNDALRKIELTIAGEDGIQEYRVDNITIDYVYRNYFSNPPRTGDTLKIRAMISNNDWDN
jgi:hypothetical protein